MKILNEKEKTLSKFLAISETKTQNCMYNFGNKIPKLNMYNFKILFP